MTNGSYKLEGTSHLFVEGLTLLFASMETTNDEPWEYFVADAFVDSIDDKAQGQELHARDGRVGFRFPHSGLYLIQALDAYYPANLYLAVTEDRSCELTQPQFARAVRGLRAAGIDAATPPALMTTVTEAVLDAELRAQDLLGDVGRTVEAMLAPPRLG